MGAAPKDSKGKTVAVIVISALVLIGGSVGTYLFLNKDAGSQGQNDSDTDDGNGSDTDGDDSTTPTDGGPTTDGGPETNDDSDAGNGPGGIIPPKPEKLTPELLETIGEDVGDRLLGAASDLAHEAEKYDEAVRVLERFPAWLRDATISKDIDVKLATYSKFAGFRKRLEGALKKGAGDPSLRREILRVSRPNLAEELADLPCVARFKEDARSVLGDSAYDAIELEAADLDDFDDMNSQGLDD
jgi:hypothetical protein